MEIPLRLGAPGHLPILVGFADEGIEIVIPVRIEQPQAGEVAGESELFGRGGKQQQAWGMAAERVDGIVGRRRGLRRPLQMVRFVNDEDVPSGAERLLEANRALEEEPEIGQYQLVLEERVGAGQCGGLSD